MRIKKLAFENINSYEGRVEIDFTDPSFKKGNNQFVISGPMGAGKSTILDAITLALYGSTARLGRLVAPKSQKSETYEPSEIQKVKADELINKHSGYCISEVVYSCSKGNFKSTCKIRRAGGKTDGRIQPIECVVYELADGEIIKTVLDGKTTEALGKMTEELIGLNYEQFVRCILIPQGEFDRFLTSSDRDKAKILAKLSHTEYFRQAASILYDTAQEKERDFKELEKRRNEIHVMDEKERRKKEEERDLLNDEIKQWKQKLKELEEKIDWINNLQKAEKEHTDATVEFNAVNSRQEEIKQKTLERDNAKKAADCNLDYRRLEECREGQNRLNRLLQDSQEKFEVKNGEKVDAEAVLKQKNEIYEKKKEEKKELKETWDKVKGLDIKISAAQATKAQKEKAYNEEKKSFEATKKRLESDKGKISENGKQIKELKAYLDENALDEKLGEVQAKFVENRKSWKRLGEQYDKECEKERECDEKLAKLNEEQAKLTQEENEISENLRNLVNSKYLLVAGILRQNLSKGKPCPVCGKVFSDMNNPDLQEKHMHADGEVEGEQDLVAVDISQMHDELEKIKDLKNGKDAEILAVKNTLEITRKNMEQAKSDLESLCGDINDLLKDWNMQVDGNTSEDDLDVIGNSLRERDSVYRNKKGRHDQLDRESEALNAGINSVDFDELERRCESAYKQFEEADKDYKGLTLERTTLFGDKNVKDVEDAFEKELSQMERDKDAADKKLQEIVNAIGRTESDIKNFNIQRQELEEKGQETEKTLHEKMEKHQFASKEEFMGCLRTEADLQGLEQCIDAYKVEKAKADTMYNSTKDALEELCIQALTDETKDSLNAQKEELDNLVGEKQREIGSMDLTLKHDDDNKKNWMEADEALKKLGTEAEIYSKIKDMLGVKDGSDFEVFVQGIAMYSLLAKANEYLSSIIPRYRLVQKRKNSIDFFVQETMEDLSVLERELSNFSGGEKFIISLSLALAMAEFAGKNGDVECIFLDEGFGTLSGEPLMDAITALKKLSSTGKMLGIITHIEAVIQAFNKIEAVKTGEKSILKGPGVTCTSVAGKKKK